MFMLRNGAVPLRTTDGAKTWTELTKTAPLFANGSPTLDGSLSWSGKTLVLHGVDLSAISRGAYGTTVWKSGERPLERTAPNALTMWCTGTCNRTGREWDGRGCLHIGNQVVVWVGGRRAGERG